ncbi:hypothetical protein AC578_10764 [Pseudocercospora eumusae]|uniref:Uncharacterized protein n=1 Tax=Pseudocercospora eumusae TaxID=321146 RepID=A0A139GZS4_9PEZI|nr:hypothetical protein AC578_10764 [Pseudocercospora eumusae]
MAKSATSLGSSLPHLPELCALPTSEESVWGMISRGDIEEWSWRASRKISPERRYLSQLGGHFDNVASIPWTYRLGDFDISVVRIPQYPKPSLTCVRRSVKSEIEVHRVFFNTKASLIHIDTSESPLSAAMAWQRLRPSLLLAESRRSGFVERHKAKTSEGRLPVLGAVGDGSEGSKRRKTQQVP